jgi:cytochrome c oxidase assembly protein subunit 15
MTEVDLYNLEPILELMAVGLAVAALPLGWWLWRQRSASPSGRLKALTLITLFLTFDLVLFGAFTRLTDSGLGCPDWPGCYGSATPIGAKAEIKAAETAMPTGPVTKSKAWIEMVHRYLATGVGVLILTLAAMTWWLRRQSREVSPWLPTLTLVWVCMQGAFGALTVTMKLFPAIVTLHLMGGIGLLVLLTAQARAPCRRHCAQVCGQALFCCACKLHWVAGSAPITRCWLAPTSPPATASGCPR